MTIKRCAACGNEFQPRNQVQNQTFCSASECQRERRRRWQRDKLQADPDYRDNQARAQRAWMDRNPDYWREYRDAHPKYVKRNRNRQRTRGTQPQNPLIAKMDVSALPQTLPSGVYCLRPVAVPDIAKMDVLEAHQSFPSGIYHIRPVIDSGVAKMDAWTVEITLLSAACPCVEAVCKEMT